MTPPSAFLVAPTVQLNALPDGERDVIRRLFTQHLRGVDDESEAFLRRLYYDLTRAEPGECFALCRDEERDLRFHARHRAILDKLFKAQEDIGYVDDLHSWLKVRVSFVHWRPTSSGRLVPVPRSTAFKECAEEDFRAFHRRMVDALHEPDVQEKFWPRLSLKERAEMVESVLAKPEEESR